MGGWILRLVGGLVIGLAALFGLFIVGMRTKSPAVQDRVRRLARDVGNPRVLRRAGTPNAGASVIRHTGWVSGRTYETSVVPHAVEDDYLIALPYSSLPPSEQHTLRLFRVDECLRVTAEVAGAPTAPATPATSG